MPFSKSSPSNHFCLPTPSPTFRFGPNLGAISARFSSAHSAGLAFYHLLFLPRNTFTVIYDHHLDPIARSKMASDFFFDPLKLLRVAPLLTTTSTLVYAWDEHWYLSGFLHSEHQHREETKKILPGYFRRFFEQGVFIIAGLNTLTISTAITNLLTDRPVLNHLRSSRWYWAGLGFTICHFLFVPLIAYPIRDIMEDRSKGNSTKDLRRWIDIHRIRVLMADLPAWISFLGAVLSTISL